MTKNANGLLFCQHGESLLLNGISLYEMYVIQHEVEMIKRKSVSEYFYPSFFNKYYCTIFWGNTCILSPRRFKKSKNCEWLETLNDMPFYGNLEISLVFNVHKKEENRSNFKGIVASKNLHIIKIK